MFDQYRSVATFLEPVLCEPVAAAMPFMSTTSRSLLRTTVRAVQRASHRGGIEARFSPGGNYIAVTTTRVVLLRGPTEPLELLAQWPRHHVSGTARRKHWVGSGEELHDQRLLRTTLVVPGGEVRFDLDEQRGGCEMLAALGITVPAGS